MSTYFPVPQEPPGLQDSIDLLKHATRGWGAYLAGLARIAAQVWHREWRDAESLRKNHYHETRLLVWRLAKKNRPGARILIAQLWADTRAGDREQVSLNERLLRIQSAWHKLLEAGMIGTRMERTFAALRLIVETVPVAQWVG